MKKAITGITLIFTIILCYAQQDPQWIISFYFETADGQKDTVYIGYDPEAHESPDYIDEQFELIEQFIAPNLDIFNAYVEGSLGYGEGYYDIRKGTVKNNLLEYTHINFIGTGTYPIKMKWDYFKLYSKNLPDTYPIIPDRPRARIDLYPGIQYCDNMCVDDCYYICTDSLYPELNDYLTWDCQGIFDDSVVFENWIPLNVQEGQGMMIRIRSYDTIAHWWPDANVIQSVLPNINVYPNPADSYFKIDNLENEELKIEILDFTGRPVKSLNSYSRTKMEIYINDLKKGMYLLKISNLHNKIIFTKKIQKLN